MPTIADNRSPYLLYMYTTPCQPDALTIDNFIILRPIEWGITTPGVTVGLAGLIDTHRSAVKGFYPKYGTKSFEKNAQSDEPYLVINYGTYSLNVALQGWIGFGPQ